jgi:hypothetical protein
MNMLEIFHLLFYSGNLEDILIHLSFSAAAGGDENKLLGQSMRQANK